MERNLCKTEKNIGIELIKVLSVLCVVVLHLPTLL